MIEHRIRFALGLLIASASLGCSSSGGGTAGDAATGAQGAGSGGSLTGDSGVQPGVDAGNTTGTGTGDGGGDAGQGGSSSDGGAADAAADSGGGASEACSVDGDCASDHCIGGVCCASACDAAPVCQTEVGATCDDGETCVYANVSNGSPCDDGTICTSDDSCQDGACTGVTESCNDDNPCTIDACDAQDGCSNDGTDITISCAADDLCATGYVCQGDYDGSCLPAETTDCSGVADDCNYGYCDDADGVCKKLPTQSGLSCDDGDACTSGESCTDGTCGAGEPSVCDDLNPCTDDDCDPVQGCVAMPNSAACDDGNPCTQDDTCSGGACQLSAARNCDDSKVCTTDSCNPAVASGDPCVHGNNMLGCDDGNSCTATDQCSGGLCAGAGNACGENATDCAEGSPNDCTCADGFSDNGAGACVPDVNECVTDNPCDANADCNDPSSALDDAECNCKTGFAGDGTLAGDGCTDIDECAGNPCGAGRGTCSQGAPGQYSCSCSAGFTQVGGSCVCDLNGTFAIRVAATMSWSGIANIEDAGSTKPVLYSWALRQQTYDSTGKLHVVTTPCGGTAADLCGTGNAFIAAEAYAQFLPVHIWGASGMPTETVNMTLSSPLPGAPFVTQPSATLLGISLTDPMGAWPSSRSAVGSGAGQTNGAIWVDHDADGKPGATTYAVPPGGLPVDGIAPDPLTAYPATSAACPRGNPLAARLPYNYWPGVEGLSLRRTRRFYVASRTIGYFDGSFTSCSLISGSIKGPANGQFQNDGRIQGCMRSSTTGETDCSGTLTDFYDTADQTAQRVQSASFVIKRLADGASCADARSATY